MTARWVHITVVRKTRWLPAPAGATAPAAFFGASYKARPPSPPPSPVFRPTPLVPVTRPPPLTRASRVYTCTCAPSAAAAAASGGALCVIHEEGGR